MRDIDEDEESREISTDIVEAMAAIIRVANGSDENKT
jgi:hypothetical protein